MKSLWYIKRFCEVDRLERRMLVKSIWLSGLTRFLTKFLPFRYYQEFIYPEIEEPVNNEDITYIAGKINKTMRRTERIVPWSLSCLVKAIVARKLYAETGIKGKLILRLAYNEEKNLYAHALFRPDVKHTGIKLDTNKQAFLFYL
jgi:hypothetical protein